MVGELLGDLMDRGLDFSQPPLYVLDGGKALSTAVKKHGGESAPLQRCQVHKRRNVLSQFFHGEPGVWDNAPTAAVRHTLATAALRSARS